MSELTANGVPESREEWRARHVRIAEKNLAILRANGLRFEIRETRDGLLGAPALFREPGKPRVDFYLSTGRWRVVGAPEPTRMFRGQALAFVRWYAKQPGGKHRGAPWPLP